jgi:uncharacterized protein with ParB-like and HNH nuclease domain
VVFRHEGEEESGDSKGAERGRSDAGTRRAYRGGWANVYRAVTFWQVRLGASMPYEAAQTVRDVVENIRQRRFVLPSIQREFVWTESQIVKLFDSLLQGYPIGSMMYWRAEGDTVRKFQFYDFVQNYHERDLRHNPKSATPRDEVTVVIDGQQRLTSLYLGLLGSYARKTPWARKKNPDAYQVRKLYLNLATPAAPNEFGTRYDIRFRSDRELTWEAKEADWFPMGQILRFEPKDVYSFVKDSDRKDESFALEALSAAHTAIIGRPTLPYYLETAQDLDKVLDIFIRVNSLGTPLAKADILMSIVTAHWQKHDAREAIHGVVDELNRLSGFYLDKDFVLKASLVLTGADVAFKVDNFNRQNIEGIETRWEDISESLRVTVELVSRFGYNGARLLTNNALIPIAYYVLNSGAMRSLLDSSKYGSDREAIRRWLALVILQQTFGGATDSVLRWIREAMSPLSDGFPSDQIANRLAREGRRLTFSDDELPSLLEYTYGDKYTFSILSILYPDLATPRPDVDHVFPQDHFGDRELTKSGIPESKWDEYTSACNQLANLQLLEGTANQEKSAMPFSDWLTQTYPDPAKRRVYMERNLIPDVDLGFENFPEFVQEREKLILARLAELTR